VLALVPFTPSVDRVLQARNDRPSVLLAADGSVLATFRRGHREWIPLDRVPEHVVHALVATEDHRFWEHRGIDWRRTFASALYTVAGDRQGGSTITQQLARNFFPEAIGRAPTVTRKLKEMITAVKIERAYSKREILEAYLNTVSFHYNANGIEMAARTYFDKPAAELTLAEGATLVGMLKGTRAYNPVLNPERARERRNLVLAQMVRHGMLEAKTYERLRRQPLRIDFERQDLDLGPAPHFAEAVRRFLLGWGEALGLDLYADGLIVHSTLDPGLQRLALQAVARQLDALQAVADVEWALPESRLLSTQMAPYRRMRARVEPFRHFWSSRGDLVDAFIRESPSPRSSSKRSARVALRSSRSAWACATARSTRCLRLRSAPARSACSRWRARTRRSPRRANTARRGSSRASPTEPAGCSPTSRRRPANACSTPGSPPNSPRCCAPRSTAAPRAASAMCTASPPTSPARPAPRRTIPTAGSC